MPVRQYHNNTIKLAAVTGATGFVGGHLLQRLKEEGLPVKALVRPTTSNEKRRQMEVQIVEGTLHDMNALVQTFEGADVVFHLAARVTDWGPKALFKEVNVDGTQNVLQAASQAGVRRLVFASSDTVYGHEKQSHNTNEDAPLTTRMTEHYTWSKIEAERLCQEYSASGNLETCVARIGWVWGAGDYTILPRLIAFVRSPIFFYPGDGQNLINLAYVKNVAHALFLMVTRTVAKDETFNVNDGRCIAFMEFLQRLMQALDEPQPARRFLPKKLALFFAFCFETLGKVLRSDKEPLMTRYGIHVISSNLHVSNEKLQTVLGFQPLTRFCEELHAMAAWWKTIEGRPDK